MDIFYLKTIFKYGNAKTRLVLQRKPYFCSIIFWGQMKKTRP